MKVLLDTHAALWWASDSPKLSVRAKQLLQDTQTAGLLSAASAWEIAIKHHSGRLPLPETPEDLLHRLIKELDLAILPIEVPHALKSASLPPHHRDPFDRLLIAQAILEKVPILSADKRFGEYQIEVVW
jgi:PIN domain nuclease of toxin-antitoxin system